ncbi:MAG: glycine cleavage T C-terminal barrel domain-containing protein, partial [Pseudomonadota bacterium]
FTGHGNVELTALKAIEDYQNEFRFHFPHEHRPAGRNAKTTPLTPVLAAEGAVFTVVNGWERAEMFPPEGFAETHSFRFTEAFDVVASEVANVRDNVGLTEVNGFNRIEVSGPAVRDFLDWMICGKVTKRSGRVGLGYMLNQHGCLKSEVTVANLPDGRIWLGSAAAAEWHDLDWLRQRAPEGVTLKGLTNDYTILLLAGPGARQVLSRSSRGDWSAAAFPWLSVREAFIGIAPAVVMSVSFSGELAYEIHVPNNQLYAAYLALRTAGDGLGLKLFGARAVESMRLEKGYLHWKADILTEFDPFETGLDRFVDMSKDFHGKAALQARVQTKKLVTLALETKAAPAHGGASVMIDDRVVGTVTSGDWGHRTGLNLAYAFVDKELSDVGQTFEVDVIGMMVPAKIIEPCPYDPGTTRPRS